MKRLCIADLQVDLNCRYETLLKQTIPYEIGADTEKTAQISVDVPDSEIEKGISKYPSLSKDDIEYVYSGGRFYRQLLDFNGMMLHASAVVKNGYAYLFSANPGTGKSTHTSLWLKVFKDDAFIINDDKPALRIIDGEIFVYGTPFSGKTDLSTNTRAKMGGICFCFPIIPFSTFSIFSFSNDNDCTSICLIIFPSQSAVSRFSPNFKVASYVLS